MKVIGAGLPRTATLTQKVALEMLGFGPCHHMVNLFADMDEVAVWRQAFEGARDWDRILAGFQSAVDWPASFYYRDLAGHYPEAKVLLSVRDPAAWARSMRATIWDSFHGDTPAHHIYAAAAQVDPRMRDYDDLLQTMWDAHGAFTRDGAVQNGLGDVLVRHTEAVKQAVPADRLLVWNVNEGWEPLCAFLGVEVPDGPLPTLNDSRTYFERVTQMTLGMLNEWWQREHPE
ncbi:MAG: sulfotransferase family protein [Solirubrobacteraceae bacterium]|jgi:hypothetical protein